MKQLFYRLDSGQYNETFENLRARLAERAVGDFRKEIAFNNFEESF
jgi:hypothetical protein